MIVIGADEVEHALDHATCIDLMREAMIALSLGRTRQVLRAIVDLGGGDLFGVVPGALDGAGFGAKLVSVFPAAATHGRSHQGAILLFDRATGAPTCVIDAGSVTAIRTACASAAATHALARPDARRLALLGTGEQAWQHALAIPHVCALDSIIIWGRARDKAEALAERVTVATKLPVAVADNAAEAAGDADIICTTTAATQPILRNDEVADGTHLNLVGSSYAGPVEIDSAMVRRARFFPDHRDGVLAQGAEYLRARAEGLIEAGHLLPEIGLILAGAAPGRRTATEVTIYKSLGAVVQDLACADFLYRKHAASISATSA